MSGIYSDLAAVMADCDHVAKRDRNSHQNFVFRGIDAVVNAVGPVLRKHGIIVVPKLETVSYDTVQTSGGKPSTACRVVVTYEFFAGDGSSIETRVAGEAWDAGDKATPKAMSVAFRTALIQALALPTDEPDPDTHTYTREAVTGHPVAAEAVPYPDAGKPVTDVTRKHMFGLFSKKAGPDGAPVNDAAQQIEAIRMVTGVDYQSRADLTEADAQTVIAWLRGRPDATVATEARA